MIFAIFDGKELTMFVRTFAILAMLVFISNISAQLSLPGFASHQKFHWHNSPQSFKITSDGLIAVAGTSTDMFRDPGVTYNTDTAPKLLTTVSGDFVLSAGVSHAFESKWDGGALVLMQDSFHWVKFCFEKDYLGKKRVVSVVTRDVSDDCNSEVVNGDKVYYKMARKGKVVTLYYSADNVSWTLVRHLQLDWTRDLKLGFLAQSPTGAQCEVKFTEVQFVYKSISDPYTGN